MFGAKSLRSIGVVTLFFFTFFILFADFNFVQAKDKEEDSLLKARKLYQQGDYEGSIKLLSDFVQKLKAMVEQKKNVAEAFYLLAKIYYEVGDDTKVDENLRKVFETYPSFTMEEENLSFKGRVEKIRKGVLEKKEQAVDEQAEAIKEEEESPEEEQFIEKPYPAKTKKKKFPVLLVVGGIAVVAAVVLLLSKSKEYNIVGNWTIHENYPDGTSDNQYITFIGSKTNGTFVDQDGFTGTYNVSGKSVHFSYDLGLWFSYSGTFTSKDSMEGSWSWTYEGSPVSGSWTGERGIYGGTMKKTSGAKTAVWK